MEIERARARAEELMRYHGLTSWSLVLDEARTRAGVCRPGRRQIGLSRVLTRLHTEQEVEDTILHEIAHALVGVEHGHDAVWRAQARAIGCSARRCVPETAARPDAPWTGTCPAGHVSQRYRRPVRVMSCRRCAPAFDTAAIIEWTFHGRSVSMDPRYLAELAAVTRSPRVPVAARGTGRLPSTTSAPPAPLAVGTRVVLGGRGRYAGVVGTIEKRGRTRYRVRTPLGLVTAPFVLVAPV